MNTSEQALAGRDVTVESGSDLVEFLADLNLFLAVGLEILKDGRFDHIGSVVSRHFSKLCLGQRHNKIEVEFVDFVEVVD